MTFEITFQGLSLGPIDIRWYSVMILTGLMVGVLLAQREAKRLGEDPVHVVNIAVLGAAFGLIGARAYHVLDRDQWPYYRENPGEIIAIWNGGIGIFGAIAGGALALIVYVWWNNRRASAGRGRRIEVLRWFDIGAPAFLIGQGIGRWGNFFNQELFGPPTDLPWGIPISEANRPLQYLDATHFHPLFLYESILSLIGVVVLLYVARRFAHRLRVGDIILLYFIWYPTERFALEFLRIDNWTFGPVPAAHIASVALVAGAAVALVWWRRRPYLSADLEGAQGEHSRSAQRRRRRRARDQADAESQSGG